MDEHIRWYFPEENGPSNKYVDEFADSKFSIDKWVSFTREIIQNSLDASDDEIKEPVLIKFQLEDIEKQKIPGIFELEKILKSALKNVENNNGNQSTIRRYLAGIENISKEKISCLKVSDFNTKGVKGGRDDDWGALVYDEGKSVKYRPGSAGSHGVGKKAPFIISTVNTVFYGTYNKCGEHLFEGKSSLINWYDDNNKLRQTKGWFGFVDETKPERTEKIKALTNFDDESIDGFFKRPLEYGTDVIAVSVSMADREKIKEKIILSVLENFFVAIDQEKLTVDVFGDMICKNNLSEKIEQYIIQQKRNFKHYDDIKNNIFGNLLDYYKAFKNTPECFDVVEGGVRYGKCYLYFSPTNEKDRKYYCIFRNHGMKIRDFEIPEAEQPFSAVLLIDDCPEDPLDDSLRLNSLLSETENAAHDDFVIDDEDFKLSHPIVKELFTKLRAETEKRIIEKTKIEAQEETPLEGLEDMLAIQGFIISKVSKKPATITKRKKPKIKRKGMGDKSDNYEEGVSHIGGEGIKNHHGTGDNKPAKEGKTAKAILFKNFKKEPIIVKNLNKYLVKLISNDSCDCDLRILPISSDGTLNYMPHLISSAYANGLKLEVFDDKIKNVRLEKDKETVVSFEICNNYNYALECEAYVTEEKKND